MNSVFRARTRTRMMAAVITGAALVAVSSGVATSAAGVGAPSYVAGSDILGARLTGPTDVAWFAETPNASQSVTRDAFDRSQALKLDAPSSNSQVRVLRSNGDQMRPTDLRALLAGASYSYTGSNVTFMVELFYTPQDAAYGPTGTSPCLQATDAAGPLVGQCYTTIKWEPLTSVTGEWRTVDLTADTAANSATGTGGWKNTQRIGIYEKPGPVVGNTLTEYLAQMQAHSVLSFGVALGTGTPNSLGWVRDLTVGGTGYLFGAPLTPAPPATPPVTDSAALDDLLAADPSADTTAGFSAGGAAPGTGLTGLDPSKKLDAELPWSDQGDDFVDLYAYSSPVYLGTFPVVNGKVILTGLDLSALPGGGHRLVFVGQTSNSVQVVAISISALAPTGVDGVLGLILAGGALLLVGGGLLVLRLRRSTRA